MWILQTSYLTGYMVGDFRGRETADFPSSGLSSLLTSLRYWEKLWVWITQNSDTSSGFLLGFFQSQVHTQVISSTAMLAKLGWDSWGSALEMVRITSHVTVIDQWFCCFSLMLCDREGYVSAHCYLGSVCRVILIHQWRIFVGNF